jgi:hypothetical protein
MQCKSSSPVKETTVKALQFPPSPAAGPTTRPPRTPPSRRSREPLPHRPAATEQRLLGPPGSGVGQPDLHLAVAHPGQICGLWRRGRAVQQRPVLQAEGAPMARAHRTGPGTQAPRGPDPNPWPPGREGVGGTMCPPGSPPLTVDRRVRPGRSWRIQPLPSGSLRKRSPVGATPGAWRGQINLIESAIASIDVSRGQSGDHGGVGDGVYGWLEGSTGGSSG